MPSHPSQKWCACRKGASRQHGVVCRAKVAFSVQQEVSYGDSIKVVGNHSSLGEWNADGGANLTWSEGNIWRGQIDVASNARLEFKIVKSTGYGEQHWEQCDNRTLELDSDDSVDVVMEWGCLEVRTRGGGDSIGNGDGGNGSGAASEGEASGGSGSDDAGPSFTHSTWKGKDVRFMKSNDHSGDRRGAWNTDGLEGALLTLVEGDSKAARYAHCSYQ